MKFGYRDRIVLLIVVVVLIGCIGFFVFIRPKSQQLKQNKANRDDLKNQWSAKLTEFSTIPKRQESIQKKYEIGKTKAEKFTPEMTSVELGEFIQKNFLNTEKFITDKVELIEAVSLSEKSTSALGYYYYTPSIVTYPLYEYADLDGSLAAAANEKMKEANQLGARAAQTVGSSAASLRLMINREDTMELLDAVKNYATEKSDTMIIESVTLKDTDFNENYKKDGEQQQPAPQPEEPVLDEEGNPIQQEPAANNNEDEKIPEGIKPGYTEVSIAYRVFYVQAPTTPDVGDEYDPAIWEGEEWRTVTAPVESASAE